MDHGQLPGPFLEIVEVAVSVNINSERSGEEKIGGLGIDNFEPVGSLSDYCENFGDGLALRVRDRLNNVRKRDETPKSVAALIFDTGLSTVSASDRIRKLRKGLAKNVDNFLDPVAINTIQKKNSPLELGLLECDDDFSLQMDDFKNLFDEAAKRIHSLDIVQKCSHRRNLFMSQLDQISERINSLDFAHIDEILLSVPCWSRGGGISYEREFCQLTQSQLEHLGENWSLNSLINAHIKGSNLNLGFMGLSALSTTARNFTNSLLGKGTSTLEEESNRSEYTCEEAENDNSKVMEKTSTALDIHEKLREEERRRLDKFRASKFPTGVQSDQFNDADRERDSATSSIISEVLDDLLHYEHLLCFRQHSAQVTILGCEMWPPKLYSSKISGEERPHYVTRIILSDIRVILPPNSPKCNCGDESGYGTFSSKFTKSIISRAGLDSRHAFTVRRDLQSFCLLHAELDRLLKELTTYDIEIYSPHFPDAFAIGLVEESFKSENKSSQLRDPAKFMGGQPYVYNSEIDSAHLPNCSTTQRMKLCMSSLEKYLYGVFSLMENIDDHAAELKSPYFIPQDEDPEAKFWREKRSEGLEKFLSALGLLIGNFLQASDLQDILEVRESSGSISSGPLQAVPELSTSITSSSCSPTSSSSTSSAPTLSSMSIEKRRPCWYPFANEGLRLQLQVHDEQGGRLSIREDDELLRRQKFKCLGCGEPLQSLFFGLDQNYLPCRYTGGLFCKRWCHSNDHRIIPHRLLLYWDCVPHRICQQATNFLDDIWEKPVLNVKDINSLLYEGIPALTYTKNLRGRAVSLFETMIGINASKAIEVTKDTLGHDLHFLLSNEFYSLRNLLGVNNCETQSLLKTFTKRLIEISPSSVQCGDLDESVLDANVPSSLTVTIGKLIQNLSDTILENMV